ncbi:DUF2147 domain-containing protein [Aridibaculum aurantiacum]|uniref:DUF2147 domain-containing protein n=1 Tax=Aridibaculum aurantiacum TaxID=2810307 RepID=UPI001A96183C|nr:DUF2147 domain-containing protein [Aridibaculum aurantiacum]
MKNLIVATILSLFMTTAVSANADAILGVWQNGSGKGHIQIYKENGKYFGKVIWLKEPLNSEGKPRLDVKNAEVEKRNKPIIGSIILRDFVYDDAEWNSGRIYNPEDGKEYKAFLKLKDSKTLSVRGYIGFSWIGKTDTWTKIR